jgi:hypothetical protein
MTTTAPQTQERTLSNGEARARSSVERVEEWSRRAGDIAKTTAERVPAAAVVVVGGGVLLALDAFGLGEVLTAGAAGYLAYRLLRRKARSRERAT